MTVLRTDFSFRSGFSLVVCLSALVLHGCGGGSGGTNNTNFSSGGGTTVASGQFVDQVVSGLRYASGSQSGFTDTSGRFTYEDGSNVTFSIGAVVLGSAPGKDIVTPVSLVPGSDAANIRVRNIARFLMMLDLDQDASNGITISSAVRASAAGWIPPDFSSATFDTDAATTQIVTAANSADNGGIANPAKTLPSASTAQNHLTASIRCTYTGMYAGNWTGTYSPPGTPYSGTWRSVIDPVSGVIAGRSINNNNFYWTQSGATTTSESGNYIVSATGFTMTGTLSGEEMSGAWVDTATIPNSTGNGTMSGTRQPISLPTGATGTSYRGVAYGENNLPAGYRTLVSLLFTLNGSTVAGTAIAEHYIPPNSSNSAQLVLAQYSVVGSVSGNTVTAQIVDTANNSVASGSALLAPDGTLSGTWSSSLTGESGTLRACRAF